MGLIVLFALGKFKDLINSLQRGYYKKGVGQDRYRKPAKVERKMDFLLILSDTKTYKED